MWSRGFNPRDRLFQPALQRSMEDCRARQSLAGADPGPEFVPSDLSGLVDWHRADDPGITLVGSKVSFWPDRSGLGHHLSQSTDARRPTLVGSVINSRPAVRFGNGDAGANLFLDWADWAHTSAETMFAVIRYVAAPALDYQVFAVGAANLSRYIASTGTHQPMIFDGSIRALGTAITDGSPALVKWATKNIVEGQREYYTQVNSVAEVAEVLPGSPGISADSFATLGYDPAVSTTQDLQSYVAELIVYNRDLSPDEDLKIRQYVSRFYAQQL